MLKNYLKTTFRNFARNKGYTAINILGLSIGIAAAVLILLWIQNEMSMDRFHEKGDRTYVLYNRNQQSNGNIAAWDVTPRILGPTLKADYPEVEAYSRLSRTESVFTVDDKNIKSTGQFVDADFLSMFSFPMMQGDSEQALSDTYNIVLTKRLAKALFGDNEAIGKTVVLDSKQPLLVTGILEDLPNHTQFSFNYLLSMKYSDVLEGGEDTNWGNNSTKTYVMLKEGTSQPVFDEKIKNVKKDYTKADIFPSTHEVFTHSLNDYYLYNKSENGRMVAGNLVTVRLFGVIATLILLIACINFMNLSTARSEKRAKEVGIRKVVGGARKGLIMQFLGESMLLSLISLVIALVTVALVLPYFNQLVQKELSIPVQNPLFWLFGLLFVLFTGLVAGSYPAFYLSSFNPVKVLKGTFRQAKSALTPRKVLVTIQFTFAIVLLIATIVISNQIRFVTEREAGYDREQLIYLDYDVALPKHIESVRHELENQGSILSMTVTSSPITQVWSLGGGYEWEGSNESEEGVDFVRIGANADFVKTMGIELVAGRDIDVRKFPSDSTAMLITETAAKAMNMDNPVGKRMNYKGSTEYMPIVGVIKDFIIESPFQAKIRPLLVQGPKLSWESFVHLRLNPANSIRDNLNTIERVLKKYNPNVPFGYTFVDEAYAQKFSRAERTYKLVILFAGLTIFISCLGLFGLATYMAESRIKEIGVRKVLGASVFQITRLLSKEFLALMLLAFVIASPIAWYVMNKWLEDYSYKIGISWGIFAFAVCITTLITLSTVSWQAIRAAMANPVDSLRDE